MNKKEIKVILIENTAFQNVGKALLKECSNNFEIAKFQIADFIQYCIQLIFYEKTYISGTVPKKVLNDSKNIIDLLQNTYSINNISFKLVEDDSEDTEKLIDAVSIVLLDKKLDNFADKYKNVTQSDARHLLSSLPPDAVEKITKTTEAIKNKNIEKVFDEYLQSSCFSNDSCFFRIINAKNEIIDKLYNINNIAEWNIAMTYGLIAEIRAITNRELAILSKQIYFPSVVRGVEDKKNILNPEDFESIIKEWGNVGILERYEMPSIKQYLIEMSKGNPKEIIKIAYELREVFKPIREFLYIEGQNNKAKQIHILEEIGNKLFAKKKGIYNESVIYTSFTGSLNLGPIGFSKQIINSLAMDREKKINICVEAFTEVIDKMLSLNGSDYEKELIKNCMKN